jgi:hypothetical protein
VSAGSGGGFSRRRLLVTSGVGTALLAVGDRSAARAAAATVDSDETEVLFAGLADALRDSPDLVVDDAAIAQARQRFGVAAAAWESHRRDRVTADLRLLTGARVSAPSGGTRQARQAALHARVVAEREALQLAPGGTVQRESDAGTYETLRLVISHFLPDPLSNFPNPPVRLANGTVV